MIQINDFIRKSQEGGNFTKEELVEMLSYPSDSGATYQIMAEANRLSKELTGNRAEVHGQFSLNLAPCTCNCLFCSFAAANGVFTRETRITPEEAVASARQLEAEGANLFWAEIGANPRDTAERTETSRGNDVPKCRSLFQDSGWDVLAGPSQFFRLIRSGGRRNAQQNPPAAWRTPYDFF